VRRGGKGEREWERGRERIVLNLGEQGGSSSKKEKKGSHKSLGRVGLSLKPLNNLEKRNDLYTFERERRLH